MGRSDQPDLFGSEATAASTGEGVAASEYKADPDKVRVRLRRILAEAQAAQTLPWDSSRVRLYRTIFPQMTNWLPEEEAARLRFEFEAEMERLKAA